MSLRDDLSTLLKPGEAEVELIRPHPITLVPSVGGGVALVLADFFLIAWWFQSKSWGAFGFSVVLIVAGIIIGRGLYQWLNNILLITTSRIIDVSQRGFFRRTVAEASYDKIQDVRYTVSGVWQTIFQFGSVVVQTAGTNTTLDIWGIQNPQEIQRLITDTQAAARTTVTDSLSAEELVNLVNRLKKHLGPEEFEKFIKPTDKP